MALLVARLMYLVLQWLRVLLKAPVKFWNKFHAAMTRVAVPKVLALAVVKQQAISLVFHIYRRLLQG